MNYLFLLKRFELWLLFGIVVALLIFAFQPVEDPIVADDPEEEVLSGTLQLPGVEKELQEEPPFEVKKVAVESTEQGQVVAVTLLARAETETPIPINEKTLRATTGDGLPVPRFFAPFQDEQSLLPGEESMITVRFWLAEASDSIWLDFQGARAKAVFPEES